MHKIDTNLKAVPRCLHSLLSESSWCPCIKSVQMYCQVKGILLPSLLDTWSHSLALSDRSITPSMEWNDPPGMHACRQAITSRPFFFLLQSLSFGERKVPCLSKTTQVKQEKNWDLLSSQKMQRQPIGSSHSTAGHTTSLYDCLRAFSHLFPKFVPSNIKQCSVWNLVYLAV